MGVPKFYRWISERYPCLSQVVKEFQIPEFDNLYLDMNGIIHICSHPNDSNPHFRITEDKIFSDIFHYIEVLFRIIKPRKVFYMAVDGVAPRAKMNQQRGRRFRSAKEAEELIRKAQIAGEQLPKEERFDSNCITPGTEFMDRLDRQLKYFVNKKITTDPGWQEVTVYFSGHKVPGEGEHKIMDYIRWAKAQPDHNPNTRHCLYGLDADLIMLGLVTHEPHFSLLREEVRFGKRANESRQSTPEAQTFHLLHISLLREYIYHEFESLKGKLPFGYDLEKIVDDWILLGFLVGNDFIPHLPDMHINMEILPYLHKKYVQVLPSLPGYLNDGGELNLEALQSYLQSLSAFDLETFQDTQTDLRWLAGKSRKGGRRKDVEEEEEVDLGFGPFGKKEDAAEMEKLKLDFGIADLQKYFEDADAEEDVPVEDELFMVDFAKHKKQYYQQKFKMEQVDEEQLQGVAFSYVVGLQWILKYYYSGVPSWSWFYPYHYAPFVSDIKDFAHLTIEFEQGDPFLPFEQLMAVLPAASKNLLPQQLQGLMVNETSAILEYYPPDFETDLNGKRQDWEAVVLIPFINEDRLLAAMAAHLEGLSPEASARNTHGPCVHYRHNRNKAEFAYSSPWPEKFPDVLHCRVDGTELSMYPHEIDPKDLVKGLCVGVKLDVFFPGFPTLKHVLYRARLSHWGVKVFQMNSKGESMTLTVEREETDAASDSHQLNKIAKELIGSECHVGWPHLVEAKVVAISNSTTKFAGEFDQQGRVKLLNEQQLGDKEISTWKAQAEGISQRYHDRMGIALGRIDVLVEVLELQGRQFVSSPSGGKGAVVVVKRFMTETSMYAHQTVVKDIAVHAPEYRDKVKTVADLYPPKTEVFLLHPSFYGCQGEVERVDMKPHSPVVYVTVRIDPDPEIKEAILDDFSLRDTYHPMGVVAEQVGVSSRVVARLTSAIRCEKGSKGSKNQGGKVFIGLNLKFAKRNEELPGYSRFQENRGWSFSDAAVDILKEFKQKFPCVFEYLEEHLSDEVFYEDDLFPNKEDTEQSLSKLRDWLKQLPTSGMKPVACGGEALDEGQVMAVEKIVDKFKEKKLIAQVQRGKKMDFKHLFRPMEGMGTLAADSSAEFYLLDRVINVMTNGAVPYKLKGTIVGIHGSGKSLLYSVVWDEPFLGGVSCHCSPNRGYRVPPHALLNITHGKSLQQQSASKPMRYKQHGHYPAPTSYASAITASSSGSSDNWRRQQDVSYAQKHPSKAYHRTLDEFTDGGASIPSLDLTNDASSVPPYGGASGKGKKAKDVSSPASSQQQQQHSGKSLFDPQAKHQKDTSRVTVGRKDQSGTKSSAAASEFAGLMKEMQSLSTKTPQPGPAKTDKGAKSGFHGKGGAQIGSGTRTESKNQSGNKTPIQSDSQVEGGAATRKGKSYDRTRKSQPKQSSSEEKVNGDSLATAASKLEGLMSPVSQLDSPTAGPGTPSTSSQTPSMSVPPSTSAHLAESVAVLFQSATASTPPPTTLTAFHQRPHPPPLLAYPPPPYPAYPGPPPPWMMPHYPSQHPGPHQPYMYNPGRFPLLSPQRLPHPYPMAHGRAPHMSWAGHPPHPPPSQVSTTRPVGSAMQPARQRDAALPVGASLLSPPAPGPTAPAPQQGRVGKHQLRTTATPFIPTAVMRRSAAQIKQLEDPQPEAARDTPQDVGTAEQGRDTELVEDEKAHFQLLMDKISAHPPTVEEVKEKGGDALKGTQKVNKELMPESSKVVNATDTADTGRSTSKDDCEHVSSSAPLHETVDTEEVPSISGQLLAVSSTQPAVDAGSVCVPEEQQWLQETLHDSDGSTEGSDILQIPETETGAVGEEQSVVVGGTIFAQKT